MADDKSKRATMNGKPVLGVPAKSVINFAKAVRNTGGGWQSSDHPEVHFRVVLWAEDRTFDVNAGKVKGKLVEVQKRTLKEALTLAFEQLQLQLPPELYFDAES